MNARLNLLGNRRTRFGKHFVSAGMVLEDSPLPPRAGTGEDPREPGQWLRWLPRHAHQGGALPARPRRDSTLSRPGGRRRCSPTLSALHWNSPSRAPVLLTLPVVPTTPGRLPPSITTRTSSRHSWAIAFINAFNRFVIARQPGGDYQPSQSG